MAKSLLWWRDRIYVRHTERMDTTESGDVTLARAAFAEALRVQMAKAGVNKRDLSRLTKAAGSTGISEGTIGKYWRGEQTPRYPEMLQLADALGIDPAALFAYVMTVHEELKAEAG